VTPGQATTGPAVDPFGETCDPARYIARPASDVVLERLLACVGANRPVALAAAPGMGKTLLLRLLEERVADEFRCVHLSYGALDLDDLCHWVLGLIGRATDRTADAKPQQELLERAGEGAPLLIAIDDASSLPSATARGLAHLWKISEGSLRLALAAVDGYKASRVFAALGDSLEEIHLTAPLDADEMRVYLEAHLSRAPYALDASAIQWVQRLSGGVPRRINALASHRLAGRPIEQAPTGYDDVNDASWIASPSASGDDLEEFKEFDEGDYAQEFVLGAPLDELG
jgi:type II secretory pathway predicted ATPase ExeA